VLPNTDLALHVEIDGIDFDAGDDE